MWTPGRQWKLLPPLGSDIDQVLPVSSGLLVVAERSRQIGLWTGASATWSWRAAAPLGDLRRLMACGDLVTIPGEENRGHEVEVLEIRIDRLNQVGHLSLDPGSWTVAMWQDLAGNRLLLTTAAVLRLHDDLAVEVMCGLDDRSRTEVERAAPLQVRGLGDPIVLVPKDDWIEPLELSPRLGTTRRLWLRDVDGCGGLWQHYLLGDREAAGRLLRARAAAGGLLDADGSPSRLVKHLAAIPTDDGCWFVTSLGVVPPDPAAAAGNLDSLYARYQDQLPAMLTWELWLDAKAALERALHWQARLFSQPADDLGHALAAAVGVEAGKTFLEGYATGTRTLLVGSDYDGIRALFGALGPTAAPLVEQALASGTPSVAGAAAAAAGATAKDDGSLLWPGESAVPLDRLIALLAHGADEVRAAAIDSLKMLKPVGVARAVEPLLVNDEEWVRIKAVEALAQLPDTPCELIDRCCRVALGDMRHITRDLAVSALGGCAPTGQLLATFMSAITDIDPDVRTEAGTALERHTRSITPSQFLELADILMLLELSEQVVTLSASRVQWGVIEKLGEWQSENILDAVRTLDADQRHVFCSNFLLAVLLDHTCEGEPRLVMDKEDWAIAPELMELVGAHMGLRTEDLAPFNHAPAPVNGLARLVEKVARVDGALAQRLALLLVFRLRKHGPAPAHNSEGAASDADRPLHLRLRSLAAGGPPFSRVEALADQYAALAGLPGNVALLARAIGGDQDARFALGRRARQGELDRWPVMIPIVLALFRPRDRTRLASGILRSSRCSPLIRRWVIDRWSFSESRDCPPLPEDALAITYRDIAACGTLPMSERLDAGRRLRGLGDPGPLLALVEPLLSRQPMSRHARYLAVADVAAEGHGELFGELRGGLAASHYEPAIRAFALHGTLGDIAELKHAKDEGAPAHVVDQAIEAIQSRHQEHH